MIALIRSELLRFRSRRLVKALAVLALLGIGTIVVVLAVKSTPGSDDAFAIRDAMEFLEGTATLVVIAGWLIGTSLIGAEWQAGTITTLLTWEPRRLRVLAAKTFAAAIGVFVMILALELLFTGLMALVASTRGSTDGMDGELLRSLLGLGVRVAALAAIGAVLGLALTTVTRNTAAALGIVFVYLVVVEGLIRGYLPGWRGWLLGDISTEFLLMHGGVPDRSLWTSAGVLAMWCVAFVSIAMATFRARDVH